MLRTCCLVFSNLVEIQLPHAVFFLYVNGINISHYYVSWVKQAILGKVDKIYYKHCLCPSPFSLWHFYIYVGHLATKLSICLSLPKAPLPHFPHSSFLIFNVFPNFFFHLDLFLPHRHFPSSFIFRTSFGI